MPIRVSRQDPGLRGVLTNSALVLEAVVLLVLRLTQRDVLHRRRGQGTRSYWAGKPAAGDVREYFRQF